MKPHLFRMSLGWAFRYISPKGIPNVCVVGNVRWLGEALAGVGRGVRFIR